MLSLKKKKFVLLSNSPHPAAAATTNSNLTFCKEKETK